MPDGQIEHRVTSGSNVELQEVLADVVRNHQGCSNIVDLTGRTFKGRLSGPLKIPSNTTLRGGTIELQATAPFKTFRESSRNYQEVHVLGASGVSFENLCIKGPRNEKFAVYCEGSRVKMLGCVIEGGNLAVMLRGRADPPFSLQARLAGDLTGSSSLFARNCTFYSQESALQVTEGSQVVLADCRSVECGIWGWAIQDGSRLVAQDSSASGCAGINIAVSNHATADLTRCKLSDAQTIGLLAGESSTVTCIDCKITGNKETNAHATSQSCITVQGCDCGQSKDGHGVTVEGGASWLVAIDTKISGCGVNADVCARSSSDGAPPGLGSVLKLTRCELNDSPECGLKVMGGTATAMLCQFNNNAQGNVVVEGGVFSPTAVLMDCEACNSSEGSGLYVRGAGAFLRASNTVVRNNAKPIMVVDRAELKLHTDCTLR